MSLFLFSSGFVGPVGRLDCLFHLLLLTQIQCISIFRFQLHIFKLLTSRYVVARRFMPFIEYNSNMSCFCSKWLKVNYSSNNNNGSSSDNNINKCTWTFQITESQCVRESISICLRWNVCQSSWRTTLPMYAQTPNIPLANATHTQMTHTLLKKTLHKDWIFVITMSFVLIDHYRIDYKRFKY